MIRLESPLRRVLAVTAGAVLGLTGVVAVAAPASAHATNIDATYRCDTAEGNWVVDWTLRNDYETAATVTQLKTAPVEVQGVVKGLIIPQAEDGRDGEKTGVQIVPGTAKQATVSFTSLWSADGFVDGDNSKTVTFDGTCAPRPEQQQEQDCTKADQARFTHDFGVVDGTWTATVRLNAGIELCDAEPVTLVSYFAPRPKFSTPQYAFDHDSGVIDKQHRSVTLTVEVPDCNTQVDLFFGSKDDIISEIVEHGERYGDKKLGSRGGLGGRSKGKPGFFNGGDKACQQPAVEQVSQCDGSVVLKLSNDGKISKYPVDFTVKAGSFDKTVTVQAGKGKSLTLPAGSGQIVVTAEGFETATFAHQRPEDCELPSVVVESGCDTVVLTVRNPAGGSPVTAKVTYGDKSETVTVAAGMSQKVSFRAGTAKYATVDFPGLGTEPVKATVKRQDCESGGAAGGDDDGHGGGLPVTGPAAAGIAGGAAVLLILGAVLFFVARRRRVTFTA